MKKVMAFILVAAFLLTATAFAQEAGNPENMGTMEVAKAKQPRAQMKSPMQAQQRMMRMHDQLKKQLMGSYFLLPILQKRLNLTDAQIDKLELMKAENQKKMIDKRAEAQKLNVDLKLAMRNMNMDMGKIENIVRKISVVQMDMKLARLKSFEQAKSVLTAEQKTTLQDMWNGKFSGTKKIEHKMRKKVKSGVSSTENNDSELSLLDMIDEDADMEAEEVE